MRAVLQNQASGNWELDEILKFDIASAIEEARSSEVDSADSPETERKNHGVGAEAACGDPVGPGWM